jgi:hypothetical protein
MKFFKLKRFSAVLIILLLSIVSCTDNTLLMPEIEVEHEITLNTIQDGQIVSPDEGIPFSVGYTSGSKGGEQSLSKLEIFISDTAGNRLRELVLQGAEIPGEPGLLLDIEGLAEGVYTVTFLLYEEEELLSTNRYYFFNFENPPELLSLSAYPPVFYPGSEGLIQAHLSVRENQDPYLRWKFGNVIQAEGYYSQGYDKHIITAPVNEGIYSVQLEVFPVGPPEEKSFPFSSEAAQTAEIYVSKETEPGPHDLSPEFSYYTLFHFRGNLRDSGIKTILTGETEEEKNAELVSNPRVDLWEQMFGYYLDGESGFSIEGLTVPFFQNGFLSPFSLNFRLMLETIESGRTIYDTGLHDGSFRFRVYTEEDGKLKAYIKSGEEEKVITSEYPILTAETALSLSISVLPQETGTVVMWFLNGILVSISELSFPVTVHIPEQNEESEIQDEFAMIGGTLRTDGFTVIGGAEGVQGIIDEFGVYIRDEQSRPSPDDEVFSKAMEAEYGSSLRYAEGFEGIFIPGDLTVSGDVMISTSDLVLEPGSSVVFPDFLFEAETMLVEAGVGSDEEDTEPGRIEIRAVYAEEAETHRDDGPDDPVLLLFTDNRVSRPESEPETFIREKDAPIAMEFSFQEDILTVRVGEISTDIEVRDNSFEGIALTIFSPDGRLIPVKVSHVLARIDRDKIAARLGNDTPDESEPAEEPEEEQTKK